MKGSLLIAALAITSNFALADYSVKGEGNFNCAEYVAARRSNDAKLYSSVSWVQGFITGFNYLRASEGGAGSFIGQDFPPTAMVRWLENHCQDNMADDLADAAAALVKELADKEQSE